VNKFSTNLIIAIAAFLFGIASASALNKNSTHAHTNVVSSAVLDEMGNVCVSQD